MLAIYETVNRRLTRADEIEEGTWICLTAPSQEEIREVAATLDIEPADVQAALDPEESARISLEDGYTVIIVDIPLKVDGAAEGVYTTIPLGILLTQTTITTVCSVDTPVLSDFASCRVRGFSTKKKMRFVYQILYRAATMYQQELRLIDRRRQEIEKNLTGTLRDSDLMEMHGLESTLVYFATSLRANSSILDNRLNNAMKYLTSVTLLMAVPTVISGLYGMNVDIDGMPFSGSDYGFVIVCLLTLAICGIAAWVLHKKHML